MLRYLASILFLFFSANASVFAVNKFKNTLSDKIEIQIQKSIALEESIVFTGSLIKGQTVEHEFEGVANSPVLFTNLKTDLFVFHIKIYKGKKIVYKNNADSDEITESIFTPKQNGTYTVKLHGIRHHGDYSLRMKQITTAAELNSKQNILSPGETVGGLLAKGAIAEYHFEGAANSPVLFINSKTDSFSFNVKIYRGNKIVYKNNLDSNEAMESIFTPKKNGTYTVKLFGIRHYGYYSMSMKQIAIDTELTGKHNIVAPGMTVDGRLAKEAIAEYHFEGVANSPVRFTNLKTSLFSYYLKIYQGKKIVYKNNADSDEVTDNNFTPKQNGTYTVKLVGTRYYGKYNLTMRQ